MRWRGLNPRHPDEGQDPDRKVGPGGRGSCQPQPPPSPWGEGAAKRRMRGDGKVFAITCKHRDFPLSRRMRATLSPRERECRPSQTYPHPENLWDTYLDFREERRELSPLCPEVCGACPREGVTSQAPAGPSPGPHGTRSRPCWHPGGFGASPAREDDQISACGRPVRSLTLTTKSDPSGLPHTSHTARRKRRGAIRREAPGRLSRRPGHPPVCNRTGRPGSG